MHASGLDLRCLGRFFFLAFLLLAVGHVLRALGCLGGDWLVRRKRRRCGVFSLGKIWRRAWRKSWGGRVHCGWW